MGGRCLGAGANGGKLLDIRGHGPERAKDSGTLDEYFLVVIVSGRIGERSGLRRR